MATLNTKCLLLRVRGSFAVQMTRQLKKKGKSKQKLLASDASLFIWSNMEDPNDFKLGSEILERRRVHTYRRWLRARKLAVVSSCVAKRRRKMYGDHRSTNLFATIMGRQLQKRDRASEKLFTRCMEKHKEKHQLALRLIKRVPAKLTLVSSQMTKSKKFKAWRKGVQDFWDEVKDVFDLKTSPWTHSDHITARLKTALVQMKDSETTTARGWQQAEIRELLTRVMTMLFWT